MAFPPFHRSHLRSHTYQTLVHIISHLSAYNTPLQTPTQPLSIPDNGNGRTEQKNQEKEPKSFEFVDPEDPAGRKEIQDVEKTIEKVGDRDMDMDITSYKMIIDDIECSMGIEEISSQANCFDKEQKIMDELELVVKGTEDLVCDSGFIPLKLGLNEKHDEGGEVGLMEYQVDDDDVELLHPCVNSSRNASLLKEPEELNQLVSEGFDMTSMFNISTSTKEQSFAPVIGTSSSKHEIQQNETKLVKSVGAVVGSGEKLICVNIATNSSNILGKKGDMEDGEIFENMGINGNSFDVSFADAQILQQIEVDEFQKPEKEKGYNSTSSMVNAPQDSNNSGQVEPRTSGEKGISSGVDIAISHETIECEKAGGFGSMLKPINSKIDGMLTNLTRNQVFYGDLLEESAAKDHGNTSAIKLVDASRKRKHGLGSGEKEDKNKSVNASKKKKRGQSSENKLKNKIAYRKNRAEKNRKLGIKTLQLQHVQKPKPVSHCRHYLNGRCYEGDKCQFSHDIVPLTKSKACVFFASRSCMKGDDCPFDHQLSKYPCNNFVSTGACSRGDACFFSHQVPTNEDIPMPSNVCRPELKSPLLSGNANLNTPPSNHGSGSVQQNQFTNYAGIHSHINIERKVTDIVPKQPTPPKGISFINLPKSSGSLSTQKQGTVTTTKESPVHTREDQIASDKTQNKVENPKKLPAVTPKGVNFLSFGKGSVCSFKSSINSNANRENGIQLPQLLPFGLREKTSLSLNKDDHDKASDRTKQNVPQTDIFKNEILEKKQSVAEGMKSKVSEKTLVNVPMGDHRHSKSVQEGKRPPDNSQSLNVASATLLRPFVSNQSSEVLLSGYHKHASNTGQRALLSTLAFAKEHESDIKMKYPTSGSSG
ncbi:hypothetical protein Fmac_027080 [Flemingia macrophylla]|uniref:C3H1-type domain-containing protein n=1 Tax=Flemingia macrophylla TaxID=520843 RepID=A0ABD1LGY4_9FABA